MHKKYLVKSTVQKNENVTPERLHAISIQIAFYTVCIFHDFFLFYRLQKLLRLKFTIQDDVYCMYTLLKLEKQDLV